MSYIMVDIESDGPIPGDYSMICFGAVLVESTLGKTFDGQLRPISERWIPDALAVSGFTREQTLNFPEAESVMRQFQAWLSELDPNEDDVIRIVLDTVEHSLAPYVQLKLP